MKKVHGIILGAFVAVASLGALVIATTTQAVRDARDCNTNSIIYCGALSQSELLKKFDENKTKDLPAIYAHYGINRDDIAGKTSQIKMGKVYKDGRIEVDGKVVATGAHSVGRHNAPGSKKITINGKSYYERSNALAFQSEYIDAFVMMRGGEFYRAILTSCSNPVVATPKPKPSFACQAVKADKISRVEYAFTATAKASGGASVTKYAFDFGDGKKTTSSATKVNHTYEKAGKYTVKVTVEVLVNGQKKQVTSENCQVEITVEEEPKQPVYSCDALVGRAISLEKREYEFNLSYTAENGALLKEAAYDFGDGKTESFPADKVSPVRHTYEKAGEYAVTTTLRFEVKEGEKTVEKDVKCQTNISLGAEMCPTDSSLPKDSPDCAPCPVKGKEHLPKNSPDCETPPVQTPPELPKTGMGEALSGVIGLGSLVGAGYYWQASRRSLNETLLNK